MTLSQFVTWLHDWQELAGAALGAAFSVVVALIVAHLPMRREDFTAAMVVVSSLVSIRARHNVLVNLAKERRIPETDYPLWLSEKLLQSRPKVAPTYDVASMRIMAIDVQLAAHIALIDVSLREMNEKLYRLEEDFKAKLSTGNGLRSVESMKADAQLLAIELARLARHSACAERLITQLILSRGRTFTKMRRSLWRTKEDKACMAAIRDAS